MVTNCQCHASLNNFLCCNKIETWFFCLIVTDSRITFPHSVVLCATVCIITCNINHVYELYYNIMFEKTVHCTRMYLIAWLYKLYIIMQMLYHACVCKACRVCALRALVICESSRYGWGFILYVQFTDIVTASAVIIWTMLAPLLLVSGSYGGYNITLNLSTGCQGNTSCKAVNEPTPYKPLIFFHSKHWSGGTVMVTLIAYLQGPALPLMLSLYQPVLYSSRWWSLSVCWGGGGHYTPTNLNA